MSEVASSPTPDHVESALIDLMLAAEDAGESDIVQFCMTIRTLRQLPRQIRGHMAHIYADMGWVMRHLAGVE